MKTPQPGDRVRAEVLGWSEAQTNNKLDEPDPSIPALAKMPQFVEGVLSITAVHLPKEGISYTRYAVDGVDVDPKSVVAT